MSNKTTRKGLRSALESSDFQAGLLIFSDVQYMTWALEAQSLIKTTAPLPFPPSLDTAWADGKDATKWQLCSAPLPPLLQSGGMRGLQRTGSGTEGYLTKAGDICMPPNASDP